MASAIASTTALSSRTSVRGGASIASRRFAGADTTTRPLRRPVTTNASGMKVAVTGAGGRTGSLCMKLLAESANFATPRGLVRSDKSAAKVKKLVGGDSDDAVEVVIGDVSDPSACDALVEGCDGLVILTSAVPKPKIASIFVAIVSKILPWMDAKRPEFYFPEEGRPELVDWLYQKNQIDAAKKAGVKKVVLVSSMGGTQIDNFLNTMGDANILLWKRKAEMYLKASGLDYTVVHPGGLLDKDGEKRELLVGVDDTLLDGDRRSVPRSDVARVAVACLSAPEAKNMSFDLASREEGEGTGVTKDVGALLQTLGSKEYDYSPVKNSPVPLP